MQKDLVITILGPDRKGLVKSLSKTLKQFNGNWKESRMVHLAGQFAGLVQVSVNSEQVEELTSALKKLETDSFKVLIESNDENVNEGLTKHLELELLGQDRPGIVQDITEQLASLNVNIEELESEIKEASMSGGTLFCANIKLGLPDDISPESVQDSLESMSDQFMIDINFS